MKHISTLLIWEWTNYNNRRIDGDIKSRVVKERCNKMIGMFFLGLTEFICLIGLAVSLIGFIVNAIKKNKKKKGIYIFCIFCNLGCLYCYNA